MPITPHGGSFLHADSHMGFAIALPALSGAAHASDRRPGPPRSSSPKTHQRPWQA